MPVGDTLGPQRDAAVLVAVAHAALIVGATNSGENRTGGATVAAAVQDAPDLPNGHVSAAAVAAAAVAVAEVAARVAGAGGTGAGAGATRDDRAAAGAGVGVEVGVVAGVSGAATAIAEASRPAARVVVDGAAAAAVAVIGGAGIGMGTGKTPRGGTGAEVTMIASMPARRIALDRRGEPVAMPSKRRSRGLGPRPRQP